MFFGSRHASSNLVNRLGASDSGLVQGPDPLRTQGFAIERVPQARHVIEFPGAGSICLDKLRRKLNTDWYVAGYN